MSQTQNQQSQQSPTQQIDALRSLYSDNQSAKRVLDYFNGLPEAVRSTSMDINTISKQTGLSDHDARQALQQIAQACSQQQQTEGGPSQSNRATEVQFSQDLRIIGQVATGKLNTWASGSDRSTQAGGAS